MGKRGAGMKTNCKPGDLAVVVKAKHSRHIGSLVRVIGKSEFPHSSGLFSWLAVGKIDGVEKAGAAPDAWLRPIRDPGDDAKDETLNWLPVPMRDEVPA